jgi:hypothetical protein
MPEAKYRATGVSQECPSPFRYFHYWKLISIAIAIQAAVVCAKDVHFDASTVVSGSEVNIRAIGHADIDGDGDQDIIGAGSGTNCITWQENTNADGSAWSRHIVEAGSFDVSAVLAADFDGDGDQDIIYSLGDLEVVKWCENTSGDGSTWATHTILDGGSSQNRLRCFTIADVDADGDPDVVVNVTEVSFGIFNSVAWYENLSGDGSSWTNHYIAAGELSSISTGDLDRDGAVDVVCASDADNNIVYYANTAHDGSSWVQRNISNGISTPWNSLSQLSCSDLDKDGDLDVLHSGVDDDSAWIENTDSFGGTWSSHVTGFLGSPSIDAADVDADGDADLITWNNGVTSGTNSLYFGEAEPAGDNISWEPHEISTLFNNISAICIVDVDNDGDLDIASAYNLNSAILLNHNETIHRSAEFPLKTIIPSDPGYSFVPFSIRSADLNRDGKRDLISINATSSAMVEQRKLSDDGSSWQTRTIAPSVVDRSFQQIEPVDINGDGKLDVLYSDIGNSETGWYRNINNDSSWDQNPVSLTKAYTWMFPADVDGDGDYDVLYADASSLKTGWQENVSGIGSAWTDQNISSFGGGANPLFISGADLDKDGDMDAVVASSSDNRLSWFENTAGNGSAWSAHLISNLQAPFSVHTADMDHDGDADVVAGFQDDNTIAWFENNGAWTRHLISDSAPDARYFTIADMDEDGDQDILAVAPFDAQASYYENSAGNGLSWATHVISTTLSVPSDIIPEDIDQDGDLDVVTVSQGSGEITWHPNEGGQFALSTSSTAPPSLANAATDDFLKITATHRGRSGDNPGELASIELQFDDGSGAPGSTPLTTAQANAVIENIAIAKDDGNGTFDELGDTLMASYSALTLDGQGRESFTLPDNDTNAQFDYGDPSTYFVVIQSTADASSQIPASFRITHVTSASSTGEDPANDAPLLLEYTPDVSTSGVALPVTFSRFSLE